MQAAHTLSDALMVASVDVRRLALSHPSAARLARVLLAWGTAESIGKPEMCLPMALTQEELVSLVGCAPVTVTRLLWSTGGRSIAVHVVSILIRFPKKSGRIAA